MPVIPFDHIYVKKKKKANLTTWKLQEFRNVFSSQVLRFLVATLLTGTQPAH